MPIYEFQCRSCQKQFELRQLVQEHVTRTPPCPWCGSTQVEPVFSNFFAKTARKS